MLFNFNTISSLLLFASSFDLLPFPQANAAKISMPIYRPSSRERLKKRQTDMDGWMNSLRQGVGDKYGKALESERRMSKRERERERVRRGKGADYLFNQGDTVYFGQVSLGTPQQTFFVVLDTGSSDLWLAGSSCNSGCSGVTTFNPSSSSTFKNLNKSFSIRYGSGSATGTLGQDTVSLANQTITNQIFAVADTVASGTLNSPLSGLMGLAFQTIAASRATPLAQQLAEDGVLDSPVVAFAFTRFNDNSGQRDLTEPGGLMTLGGTDPNLFTGQITQYPLANQGTYWLIPVTGVSVDGTSISVESENAAIDTGTSLIAGPTDDVAAIYAQIPGSAPYSRAQGYYTVPCDFTGSIAFQFGGSSTTWTINADDFLVGQVSSTRCVGGLFTLPSSSGTPDWIVGDVFLKNVYSVYDYTAKTVGFAALNTANVQGLENDTGSLNQLDRPTANNGTGGATIEGGTASSGQTDDNPNNVGTTGSGGTVGGGVGSTPTGSDGQVPSSASRLHPVALSLIFLPLLVLS
ncbi:acid protease [Atractiella rhizophila]|nr:acid protease [Atractiella rhizophila]